MAKTIWTKTITLALARDAELPAKGDYLLRDEKFATSGLALRVYATGGKVWICYKKVHGKPEKIVLGDFPVMTAEQARIAAQETAATIKRGEDPKLNKEKLKKEIAAEREKKELTMAVAFSEYQEDGKDSKPRTIADRLDVMKQLQAGKLWSLPLLEITGADLHAEYNRIKNNAKGGLNKGATQAGKVLRYVRAAFNHAIDKRENLIVPDPFARFNKLEKDWYKTKARERIVADTESDLPTWWQAVEDLRTRKRGVKDAETIADYLILSLLWGCRKSELLPLAWDKVNLSTRVVLITDTKNGRDLPIPFGNLANDILLRQWKRRDLSSEKERAKALYVFPSSRARKDGSWGHLTDPKKSITSVAKASVPFSPHDLRRTFATLMDDSGLASTNALEKVLNHAPTTTAGKHYLVKRLHRQRDLYQKYEDYVLEEAAVIGHDCRSQLPRDRPTR